jgi:thioredoxin-related protein
LQGSGIWRKFELESRKMKLNKLKYFWIVLLVAGIGSVSLSSYKPAGDEIHWMSFDQAVALCKTHPKKIFIDIYTQWCGWCKRMDASTYKDPAVVDYLNKNFYSVRLDAETKDTFHFKDHIFVNPHAGERGAVNELAYSLLDGKMMYPTTVYLDGDVNRLNVVPGYIETEEFKTLLKFFAEEKYKTMSYDDYKKSLTGGSTK